MVKARSVITASQESFGGFKGRVRNRSNTGLLRLLTTFVILLSGVSALLAQTPPNPAPAPGGPANIFYGSVLPTAGSGPIIVFVHGLNGIAADWWLNQVAGTPN